MSHLGAGEAEIVSLIVNGVATLAQVAGGAYGNFTKEQIAQIEADTKLRLAAMGGGGTGAKKDNTTMYIVAGGALAVMLVGFMLMRK